MPDLRIDSEGVTLPAPAGATIDFLFAHLAAGRAERARTLLERSVGESSGDGQRAARILYDALTALPVEERMAAFAVPAAFLDDPESDPLSRFRFIAGRADFFVILPPARQRLHLPHVSTTVTRDGSVLAIESRRGSVVLTGGDGTSVALFVHADEPPMLNGDPDIVETFATLGVQPESDAVACRPLFEDALSLLWMAWPEAHAAIRRHVRGVLVLSRCSDHRRSHSAPEVHGAVLTTPDDAMRIAEAFVHEGAHCRLNAFLEFDPILDDDGECRHPSPWRRELRPLIGILRGVHAFVNVCEFYRRLQNVPELAEIAASIVDHQREQIRTGWAEFSAHAHPTPIGVPLVDELRQEVGRLCH